MFVKPLLSRASSRAATLAARSSRALAPTTRLASRSLSTAVGAQLQALTTEYPHLDVVRYEHKNRVWSLQHVQYYSDALAIGLMENNLQPGDVVLSWLPEHFSEQVRQGRLDCSSFITLNYQHVIPIYLLFVFRWYCSSPVPSLA
jgi:hypothetical protein